MIPTNSTPTARFLTSVRAFADLANGLPETQFSQQLNGKWSVAETLQHLFLSARPVARLLAGPREVFQQWGQPGGSSRSYNEIADTYHRALTAGVKAPAAVLPRPDDMDVDRATIVARFMEIHELLAAAADAWSANDLDRFVIPHPVLGRLTVREMLDFMDIHTQHHLRIVQAQLT